MGSVNLTTEEYDELKNQYRVLTPCEVKDEIEKTLYFGQNIMEWRDRAITAENRLASAGMTSSWNGHECAMLKQDAALGRQVRKMPEESRLCRQCGGGWVYDHLGSDSSPMAMPEFALDQGMVKP